MAYRGSRAHGGLEGVPLLGASPASGAVRDGGAARPPAVASVTRRPPPSAPPLPWRTVAVRSLFCALLLPALFYGGMVLRRISGFAAVNTLRELAEGGDTQSQFLLGQIYLSGLSGMAPDRAQGLLWLERAADKKHPGAMHELGWALLHDEGGDLEAGATLITRAAAAGFGPAHFALGTIHERGIGRRASAALASVHYTRALELGVREARSRLADLEARLHATDASAGAAAGEGGGWIGGEVPPADREAGGGSPQAQRANHSPAGRRLLSRRLLDGVRLGLRDALTRRVARS